MNVTLTVPLWRFWSLCNFKDYSKEARSELLSVEASLNNFTVAVVQHKGSHCFKLNRCIGKRFFQLKTDGSDGLAPSLRTFSSN